MSKQKEWQYFTEVRDGLKTKHLTDVELVMYKHGLHVFSAVMLLTVIAIHIRMKLTENRRKPFSHL